MAIAIYLQASLTQFTKFVKKNKVAPVDITENLCLRFRKHLLDNFTGKSPSDYFQAFKRVIKTATKEGYFKINPAEDIKAKRNPSKSLKDFLEADEYIKLLETPVYNNEVKEAFVVSCYTGLRWCDVKDVRWEDIKDDKISTRIIQAKTGKPVVITIHPIVQSILEKRKKIFLESPNGKNKTNLKRKVFDLPTANGCNKALDNWMAAAGIEKHIT